MAYLKTVSAAQTRTASSGGKINDERTEKDMEVVAAYFKTLPRDSHRGTEEYQELQ
jgi:hypothetical protein